MTKVCVVGSGGREHALAHVLGRTAEVVVTPGNPGIPGSTNAPPDEIDADLFVIGPEQPLADGLADRLRARGALVFGPGADGARLESSKVWMKQLLVDAGVPTARHGVFNELAPARAFLASMDGCYVIKTDGLAAGKGVLVTTDRAEAEADVAAKLSGSSFGSAGRTVVIEEGMIGEELSVFALCDGRDIRVLPAAQDYKRVGDDDTGPNTGGMGACSPVPVAGSEVMDFVRAKILEPTVAELRRRGVDYRGVLYLGAMLTSEGPKVVEYNVRFGDPDGQVALLRVAGDVTDLLAQAAAGRLGDEPVESPDAHLLVVLASEGYPAAPVTGVAIDGIEAAAAEPGVLVLHAGTALDSAGRLCTAGGRVLNIVGTGPDLATARDRAYAGVSAVHWPGMHFRRDIGRRATGERATVSGGER